MTETFIQRVVESGDPLIVDEAFKQLDTRIESASSGGEKANLLLTKATLLGALGQFGDARKQLGLVLAYAPDDLDIRLQRDFIEASLYDQERKPEEAFARLTSVLSDHSERLSRPDVRFIYEDIQLRRGFDATSVGNFREALPILEECLQFDLKPADKGNVLADLGRCYSEANDYESARDCLRGAIKTRLTRESEGMAHLFLGIACGRLGRFEEAKSEFQWCEKKAAQYDLEVTKIYKWLSWVCTGLGEKEEALRYANLARPI
jgi:tetratricopeptide (TPR) repeat protein